MNKWAQRLALAFPQPSQQATGETDETRVVSVLTVPFEAPHARLEQPIAESDGPFTFRARRLPEGDRALLDCLVWLQPDTGAMTAKELALASRMPLGQVLGALDRLKSHGLVLPSGRAFRVARVLMRELGVSDPDGQLLKGSKA